MADNVEIIDPVSNGAVQNANIILVVILVQDGRTL